MTVATTRISRSVTALFCIVAITYVATIGVGIALGRPLPTAYIFTIELPISLNRILLYLPQALLVIALIGAALAWVGIGRTITDEGIWCAPHWLGATLMALLIIAILSSGGWSGFNVPIDIQYVGLLGLIPHADPTIYLLGAIELNSHGTWGGTVANRPLAAAFRTVMTVASGYSYPTGLLLQASLLSVTIAFAAHRIRLWLGLWAAVAFLGLALSMTRGYLGTAMTEPLGLIWAFLSVGFLADAMRTRTLAPMLAAICFATIAQGMRTGAFLILPVMALWAALAFSTRQTFIRNSALVAAALITPFVFDQLLLKLFAQTGSASGWGVAYVLCGLARDTSWDECARILNINTIPGGLSAQTRALFDLAWSSFIADPSLLIAGLSRNLANCFRYLAHFMIAGYAGPALFSPADAWLWAVALVPGLALYFGRRETIGELPMWCGFALAILFSAAIVWNHDGWRSLYATHPLVAAFMAIGFFTPRQQSRTAPAVQIRTASAIVGAAAILFIAVPFALLNIERPTTPAKWAERERYLYGGSMPTGFVVLPDGAELRRDLPSIHSSEFADLVKQLGLWPNWGTYLESTLPRVPFALVWTPTIAARQNNAIYVVSPEILLRRDVKVWRIELTDWKPEKLIVFQPVDKIEAR